MKGLFIVRLRFNKRELEGEFNKWYSNIHLADMIKVERMKAARRFSSEVSDLKYLALYEFDSVEDMLKSRESPERKAALSDFARWTVHIDKIERYWLELIESESSGKIKDSEMLFLASSNSRDLEGVKSFRGVESKLVYKAISTDPGGLPSNVVILHIPSHMRGEALRIIDEISKREGVKYGLYSFISSLIRNSA